MIKLVAIDLDGTLFDKNKIISVDNKNAIARCKEKGIKVVIASGRPYNGVKNVLKELNLIDEDEYVICYNGSRVYNNKTLESIVKTGLNYDDVIKIYNESVRQNSYFHAFTDKEELFTSKFNPYTDVESTINKIEAKEVNFYNLPNYTKFIKAMIVDDKDNITNIMKNINPILPRDYQMVRSSNIFLEFLNPKTNKGFALKALAEHLNISKDQIMAIGDAGNDISMIKYASVGVAMNNAFPEVKIIADYITKNDNENSGVAEAIKKYCEI